MDRYQSHAQQVAAHDHHRFAAQLCGEVFGVPRVGEAVFVHRLLVEGSGYERVDAAFAQVGRGGAERFDGGVRRFGARMARLDGQLLRTCRHETDLSAPRLLGGGDLREAALFGRGEGAAIEGRGLRRSVNYWRTKLCHARIGECLE